MSKFLITLSVCLLIVGQSVGQNIKSHYISKAEADGMIYHALPSTLFESKDGDLTYDITYKSNSTGQAVINFTYVMKQAMGIDSVCFESNGVKLHGKVEKLYISPDKKMWKHRYSFCCPVRSLYMFFDRTATPKVTLYSQGQCYPYRVKSGEWKSYAPIGNKIFEVIRLNEAQ